MLEFFTVACGGIELASELGLSSVECLCDKYIAEK